MSEDFALKQPYNGNDPFIHLCFDIYDYSECYFFLRFLQEYDYRFSYDKITSAEPESHFFAVDAIKRCKFFICFLSKRSIKNDVIFYMIKLATKQNIPFLVIHLEEVKLPRPMHLAIADMQALMLYEMGYEPIIKQLRRMLSPILRESCTPNNAFYNLMMSDDIKEKDKPDVLISYLEYTQAVGKGDMDSAIKSLTKAADAGYAQAQYDLGVCYLNGTDVEQDYKKSFELFKKAGDQLHSEALNSLGSCYFFGRGTLRDKSKAAECFFLAADLYDEFGIVNYASCLSQGEGVVQNKRLAFEWVLQGAKLNFNNCKLILSFYYYEGTGTEKDIEKAAYWAALTSQTGFVEARKLYAKIFEEIAI